MSIQYEDVSRLPLQPKHRCTVLRRGGTCSLGRFILAKNGR